MVLDTCAVLWLAFNRENFSEETLNKIENSDNIIISTMSFWEIGIKIKKKKVTIPLSLQDLIRLYVNNENVSIIPPDLNIILQSLEFNWNHRDPVDRMIVATAKKFDDYIVTSDMAIKKFYKKTVI